MAAEWAELYLPARMGLWAGLAAMTSANECCQLLPLSHNATLPLVSTTAQSGTFLHSLSHPSTLLL